MGEARPASKVTELISLAPPRAEFPARMPKLTAGLAEHHQHLNCKYSQSAPPGPAADSICVVRLNIWASSMRPCYRANNFRRHTPIAPRIPVPRRTKLDGSGVVVTGGGTGLSVTVIVILSKN